MSKWIKVSGSFGDEDGERGGLFSGFGGRKRINDREESLSATPPPSVAQLKNYIISQCKGDAYDLFLWDNGKSVLNNPPREIVEIIRDMNPKVTGSNYLIDNIPAVNYFKSWVPMKTLGDEAFEYILDHNRENLKLYRNFGRPTQKQSIQIIKAIESGTEEEGFLTYDYIEARDKAEDKLSREKNVQKDYPGMPPLLKSSMYIRKIRF